MVTVALGGKCDVSNLKNKTKEIKSYKVHERTTQVSRNGTPSAQSPT